MRVTAVMTHPIQYYSPWFRWIAEHRPDVELTVLYAATPAAEQQGRAFGQAFEWDVPLTDGYRFEVCADAAGMEFVYGSFRGVDVPDVGPRIAATRPDVVLVAGWHSAFQVRALLACRRRGIPVIYRGDTNLTSAPPGWRRGPWVLRTWALLRLFDGWLSVGSRASRYLERFGLPEPLLARSPHAVDHDWFARKAVQARSVDVRTTLRGAAGIAPGDLVVLFAGRVVDIKRPLDAVRVVAALGDGVVLLAVGDGPVLPEMRREAERLGVRAVFTGFQNQREMVDVYAMADVHLVCSTSETWGLTVNEALASGLPCVVSDGVAAGDDLIRGGVTGEVCPAGDIAAMAGAVALVRQGLPAGRYAPAACRDAVHRAGFAEATDGLVRLGTRLLARPRREHGSPRVIACCGSMSTVFGLERMTLEVLGALRARGASVRCIVNDWGSSAIVDRAVGLGASWTTGYYRYPILTRGGVLPQLRAAWDICRTSLGLLRESLRCRPTHVFVPEYSAALRNAPALLLLRALGVTVIGRLGNAPEDTPFHRRLWRWAVSPLVSRFVANSQFTSDALAATGVSPAKIRVIPNAAPTRSEEAVCAGERDPHLVVYVGQIIPPKGVREL
ncbi:MAG: glycosyltransferase, partial [Vicinamibacterales bacterium]|nr:glycosyltransferase [Vicinamibacterales bacterium]